MDERERAHRALERRDPAAAVAAFAAILRAAPDDVEALTFLGSMAVRGGQPVEAKRLLGRAMRVAPPQPEIVETFGIALALNGEHEAAIEILRNVLRQHPKFFVARLFLGRAFEHSGNQRSALAAYARALTDAQAAQHWMSHETTPAWLSVHVLGAVRYVNDRRRALLTELLAPLDAEFGADALRRVRVFIDEWIGPPAHKPAVRQRPKQHFMPGLSQTPFFDGSSLPWLAEAESRTAAVKEELLQVMRDRAAFSPFLQLDSPAALPDFLRHSGDETPHWDAYFFYRHGQPFADHLARCPQTAALLERLPLVNIEGFAPEICFSLLTPGTHILPHTGDSNIRSVFHLPLLVPVGCELRVAGESHEWREGRGVLFDDTFEHEASNHGDETRVVLIADVWNPHLSEVERAALSKVIARIGELGREATAGEATGGST